MVSAVRWMDRNLGVALTTSDIATVSPWLDLLQGSVAADDPGWRA
jgi:hypothetical protein